MKRATLHIIVNSVCCAKIKGVDHDMGTDSSGSEEDGDPPSEGSSTDP